MRSLLRSNLAHSRDWPLCLNTCFLIGALSIFQRLKPDFLFMSSSVVRFCSAPEKSFCYFVNDRDWITNISPSVQNIHLSRILMSEGSSQMQQSNQTCLTLYAYVFCSFFLLMYPSLLTRFSLLCVMLQAPTASTLWCRIWLWQRAGRQTWPAVWSIMTTPPSSGQTQHSRPCFLGTRKVSCRMTDSSSSWHTTSAVSQSTLCVWILVAAKM